MRYNRLRNITLALAGILGLGTAVAPVAQSNTTEVVKTQRDFKAANNRVNTRHKIVNEVGGIPMVQYGGGGMTPKEYGQLYGNGGSKRSNRLRYSHNAKLKRRNNNA